MSLNPLDLLSTPWSWYLRWKLARMEIGAGSKTRFWRVRPKSGNTLRIGSKSMVQTRVVFERDSAVFSVGNRSFVGLGVVTCAERIEIGDDVLIAWGTVLSDHNSHHVSFSKRSHDVENWIEGKKDWQNVERKSIRIMDKAWIGMNSIILKGVTVGEGAVVGAGSIVTKDVPPWTVVAGNPARPIREIRAEER